MEVNSAEPVQPVSNEVATEPKVRHRKKEKKPTKPIKKVVEPVYGETDPSGTDDQSDQSEAEAPVEPQPPAVKKQKCQRCKAANPPEAKICLRCRNSLVKLCGKCQVELPPYYYEELCENCAIVEKYRQIGLKIGGVLILIGLFLNLMCRMPGASNQGSNVNMEDFMKMHRGGH